MSFNIKDHVIDHAKSVIDGLTNKDEELIHFNTSADRTYFIEQGYDTQEKIDKIMVTIQNSLLAKTLLVSEKNGVYLNKKGEKKQKYRVRKITFINMLSVYHDRHFDGSKSVNPHFHFLFNSKVRMGKNFMYLRQVLEMEAYKYDIKFNFMEEKQETGLSSLKLKYLERMSWLFHQGNEGKIYDFIHNNIDALQRNLDSLMIHYEHTANLSFFIKILLIINQRLDELNLDYIYRNINLKESIFFFLTSMQKDQIELLKLGATINISLDDVFGRELLKYAYGFNTEVMDILIDQFEIRSIEKEQLLIDEKIPSKNVEKMNLVTFRDLVIMDIRNSIAVAKNEKEFRSILREMEYFKVTIKTSKVRDGRREKIGLDIITKKKTYMFISFLQLRVSWPKIGMIFSHNTKRTKQIKKLETNLNRYEKKSNKIKTDFEKFEYRVPKFLEFFYKEKVYDIKIEKFDDYHLERSNMYNITSLINNDNSIVITENRITLKKSSGEGQAIQDMLKLAEMKGWDLNSLDVSGKEKLVEKVRVNILLRAKREILEEKDRIISVVKRGF